MPAPSPARCRTALAPKGTVPAPTNFDRMRRLAFAALTSLLLLTVAALAPERAPAAASGAPLPALAPGHASCPAAAGPLAVRGDRSGYGVQSAAAPPVLLSPGLVAYLQSVRRPVPHVAALTVATTAGSVVWRSPLAPGALPGGLAALGGGLALAVRDRAGVEVEVLDAAHGTLRTSARIAWSSGGWAPALTADGRGGLIASGPTASLPAALSGLGTAAPPLVDLGPSLGVRWRVPGVGDLVAVGAGVAVAGRRAGAGGRLVRLTGVSVATGRALWARKLTLPAVPVTASFGVDRGILVWAATWPGGGQAMALALASGAALWRMPTAQADWIAAGGAAVAGPSPWQAPTALTARNLRTGAVLWRGPAATPVVSLNGRILALALDRAALTWLWLTPPASKGGVAAAAAPAGAAASAPLPPVAVYCDAGPGAGAVLLAPSRGGVLWAVGAG